MTLNTWGPCSTPYCSTCPDIDVVFLHEERLQARGSRVHLLRPQVVGPLHHYLLSLMPVLVNFPVTPSMCKKWKRTPPRPPLHGGSIVAWGLSPGPLVDQLPGLAFLTRPALRI